MGQNCVVLVWVATLYMDSISSEDISRQRFSVDRLNTRKVLKIDDSILYSSTKRCSRLFLERDVR